MPTLAGCPINQAFLLVTNTDVNESGVAVYPLINDTSIVDGLLKSYMNVPSTTNMAVVAPADTASTLYAEVNGSNVQPSVVAMMETTIAEQNVVAAEQVVESVKQEIEASTQKLEEAKVQLEEAQVVMTTTATAATTTAATATTTATAPTSSDITETFGNIIDRFTNCGSGISFFLMILVIIVLVYLLSNGNIKSLFHYQ